MDVLLDHNVPVPLADLLVGHVVRTAVQEGWDGLSNGRLLAAAEGRFDVLVTCDQNIVHQQNLSGRTIAIVVVSTNLWSVITIQEGSGAPWMRRWPDVIRWWTIPGSGFAAGRTCPRREPDSSKQGKSGALP